MTDPRAATDPPPAASPPRTLTFRRRVDLPDLLWFAGALVLPLLLAVVLLVVAVAGLGQRWALGYFLPVGAALAALATWGVARRRGWSRRDLGLVRGRYSPWHLLWQVPLAWVAAMVPAMVLATVLGLQPGRESDTATAEALRLGPLAVVLTALAVVLVVPLLEELVFRRMVYGWIEGRAGWLLAVLGSAVAFGLAHVVPAVMVIVGAIGLAAALLVRVHRSLWPALALHAANNLLVTVLVLVGLR